MADLREILSPVHGSRARCDTPRISAPAMAAAAVKKWMADNVQAAKNMSCDIKSTRSALRALTEGEAIPVARVHEQLVDKHDGNRRGHVPPQASASPAKPLYAVILKDVHRGRI